MRRAWLLYELHDDEFYGIWFSEPDDYLMYSYKIVPIVYTKLDE